MDVPRGLRSASKAQLLDIACHLAGNEHALAEACRQVGARDVAEKIKVPAAAVTVRQQGSQWFLDGDLFDVKDVLKRRGARWNGMVGAWTFGSRQEAQAAADECIPVLAVRQELAALEAVA